MAIKKTVKTKSDLDRYALKTGSTITDKNGRKFNTGKKKAAINRPTPKKQESEEKKPVPRLEKTSTPVKEKPVQDHYLADKLESVGKANVMMLAELKNQISQIQLQSTQPILEWEFDMVRDEKGYLTKIKASGSVTKNVLN